MTNTGPENSNINSNPPTPVSPTGLLVIDKPLGWSSMDVCRNIRRRLVREGAPKRVKVGHGGTLDPLATGVLVILVGKATPLCDTIMSGEKGYRAIIQFGATSQTDDAEGPITPTENPTIPTREQIQHAIATHFVGTIMQTPPAHSAMKIGGQRAYKLAREGKQPQLSPRPIQIHEITLTAYSTDNTTETEYFNAPRITLDIRCGKGTYIRSLARDLGQHLAAGAYLAGLIRTRVGRFQLEHAVNPDSLPETRTQQDLLPIPQDLLPTQHRPSSTQT